MMKVSEHTSVQEVGFGVHEMQPNRFDDLGNPCKPPITVVTINTADAEIKVFIDGKIERVRDLFVDACEDAIVEATPERREIIERRAPAAKLAVRDDE